MDLDVYKKRQAIRDMRDELDNIRRKRDLKLLYYRKYVQYEPYFVLIMNLSWSPKFMSIFSLSR